MKKSPGTRMAGTLVRGTTLNRRSGSYDIVFCLACLIPSLILLGCDKRVEPTKNQSNQSIATNIGGQRETQSRKTTVPLPNAKSGGSEKTTTQASIKSPSPTTDSSARESIEATSPKKPTENLSIDSLQQLVINHLEAGDLDSAWRSIRIASRKDAGNFDTRYLKARVLAERNRFAEAVKILDDLAKQDPSISLPVLGQTAEWLTFDGRWKDAENRYRRLINEISEAGLAHRRLAQLLVRQGKRSEACHLFALLCQSGNVEEVELRHLLRSSRPFQGMESDGESEPIGSFGRAKFLYGENLIDEALVEIEGCDPDAEQAFALKGRLLALSAQKKELAEWDSQSIANNESLSDYWFAKGVHAQNEKNHKKAIQFLCRGILLDPTDSEAYQVLSESLKDNQQIQISEIAKKRQEKILATHKTGQAFTDSETRDPQSVASLCRILDELHRPIESLAWQAVAMVYNQEEMGLSNEQLALQLQNINQKRIRLIRNNEAEATNEFILCGLNLNQVISPASTEEKNGSEVE